MITVHIQHVHADVHLGTRFSHLHFTLSIMSEHFMSTVTKLKLNQSCSQEIAPNSSANLQPKSVWLKRSCLVATTRALLELTKLAFF